MLENEQQNMMVWMC